PGAAAPAGRPLHARGGNGIHQAAGGEMSQTINCQEAADRLQDFLRQELTPEVEAAMKAHIERCRPCFESVQFERNFLIMLETRAARECCPDKLRKRILELLRAEARRG